MEITCKKDPHFVGQLQLPEASGAVYVPGVGEVQRPFLLLVGDSGTNGQFLMLDPSTGKTIARGFLPLDPGASDDVEGLSYAGDTFYGVTSSGWMRHWRQVDGKFVLIQPAYPLAQRGSRPNLVCKTGHKTNCARNYEGLCLKNSKDVGKECAGYVASKKDGKLYCVVFRDRPGKAHFLQIDPTRTIAVAPRQTLTGCHFDLDQQTLWAGTNAFGGNTVYEVFPVSHDKFQVRKLGPLGQGFCEAIAIGPNQSVYRFSDMGGARSWSNLYWCPKLEH